MSKPSIQHAGCQGEVEVTYHEQKLFLQCQRCGRRIADAMELQPRGTGYHKEPTPVVEWDRV